MRAWKSLDKEIGGLSHKDVWESFNEMFEFNPSIYSEDWPSIIEPKPSITYDISTAYYNGNENYLVLEKDLSVKTLVAFRECLFREDKLYVLNWEHPSYLFYPYGSFDFTNSEEWLIPVFPNGDYYIFLAEDFSFGLFGHPWEQSICVFGTKLISAFEKYKPLLFTSILRSNL
ncbi:MAG: DUF2716 domain-containing protein [Candidatus Abawacabacteria bacterium]|nr:DUF2716 domain-containing protein [Candidatus Abawacabacteria bacterium]